MAVWCLVLVQGVGAARVARRLVGTAGGRRIVPVGEGGAGGERVSVLVPVLDEARRLGPCLAGLIAQGPEVAEILVVDGGSRDGTPDLVAGYAARDGRVRLLSAEPVPADWNGKAHGLQIGFAAADPAVPWVLTIDADVRPGPGLARAVVAHARRDGLPALSVATPQRLSGPGEGVIHPALLTTLVYRFGIPGRAARRIGEVQANGQCFLIRRETLAAVGGFAATRESICEDVTLARALVAAGHPVGFFETAAGSGLIAAEMYAGAGEAWRNWTRSLPMRDRYQAGWLGLVEVSLVQALPLPLVAALRLTRGRGRPSRGRAALAGLNLGLAAMRLGVLAGTARAYPARPLTYWLSPVCDVPAAAGVWLNAIRRRHTWRGRRIVRGGPG